MSAKFLPLMRVGTFRDRHGANYSITKGVLDSVAKNFNAENPPPITVGHPDTDKVPTFGVVDALKVIGDTLFFRPAKYCAEFAALVRNGGFPGVSAGLTRDLSRLGHVAFLSAQKPAIDGLEPIAEFSAAADSPTDGIDVTETAAAGLAEFADAPDSWFANRLKTAAGLFRALKNHIIEQAGAEAADKIIPEYSIEYLQEDPPEPEPVDAAQFSSEAAANVDDVMRVAETPDVSELRAAAAEFEADAEALRVERDRYMARVAELEKQSRKAEFAAWVEERITEGRVLPDRKQATVDIMEISYLSGKAEFANGIEDVLGADSPLDAYKADIMSRPRIAPKAGAMTPPPEFAATVVQEGAELGYKAREYQKEMEAKGVRVDTLAAIKHVRGGGDGK